MDLEDINYVDITKITLPMLQDFHEPVKLLLMIQ